MCSERLMKVILQCQNRDALRLRRPATSQNIAGSKHPHSPNSVFRQWLGPRELSCGSCVRETHHMSQRPVVTSKKMTMSEDKSLWWNFFFSELSKLRRKGWLPQKHVGGSHAAIPPRGSDCQAQEGLLAKKAKKSEEDVGPNLKMTAVVFVMLLLAWFPETFRKLCLKTQLQLQKR